MPFSDGTLTELEFSSARDRLTLLWSRVGGRQPCRSCGSPHYYIHPALLGNRSDTLSPYEAHTRFPTVAVYCADCGLTEHYAARILGIQVLLPPPPVAIPPPAPAPAPAPPEPFIGKSLGDLLGDAFKPPPNG